MHDPTEGGLATALAEVATASGTGIAVDEDAVSILPEAAELCAALAVDPWGLISSGALLITAGPESASGILDAVKATGVPAVEPDTRGTTTIREQLDKHRNIERCATCHRKIDPPGFALENFDVIGGWRTHYRSLGEGERLSLKVKGRGVRYRKGPRVEAGFVDPRGRAFADIGEYRNLLMDDKEQIARCVAEKLATYATGSGVDFIDREEVDRILGRLREKNYGLRSLVHEVVQSRLFLYK